jgi:hypothetical protein
MPAMRRLPSVLPVVVVLLAAGCGGGAKETSAPTTAHPAARGDYLSAGELEVQVGNSFRRGLYRLAVMSQAEDDAKDLGQPLPTGTVDRVHCAPAASRPDGAAPWQWRCRVRWRSAAGHRQLTRYTLRVTPPGCFSAGAVPRRGARYDSTIRSYAEDPLDALVSARRGC